jgi:hypothetical protein
VLRERLTRTGVGEESRRLRNSDFVRPRLGAAARRRRRVERRILDALQQRRAARSGLQCRRHWHRQRLTSHWCAIVALYLCENGFVRRRRMSDMQK